MAETQSFLDNTGLKTFKNLNDEAYMANLTRLTDPYGFNMIEIAATFSEDLIANKTYTANLNNANEIFNLLQQSNINYQSIKLILTFNNNQINIPALFISNQNFSEWNASTILKNNNEFLYLNFIINYSTVSTITIVATRQNSENNSSAGVQFIKFGFSDKTITDASFPDASAYCGILSSDADNINFKNINIIGYKISVQMEKDGNLYIIESNILNSFQRPAWEEDKNRTLEEMTFTSYYKITVTSQEPIAYTIELIPSFLNIYVNGYGFKNDTIDGRLVYKITANNTEDLNPLLISDTTSVMGSELYFTVPQEA